MNGPLPKLLASLLALAAGAGALIAVILFLRDTLA
jgi:hypothetical protein